MRQLKALLAILLLVVGSAGAQQTTKGSLFIVGGGPRPAELMGRFVELAGGPGKAVVLVLPMASADSTAGPSLVRELAALGATARFAVIGRSEADSPATLRHLQGVTGIWFNGGVQTRLTNALGGTRFEQGMLDAYRGGAVIGGTSAGAAVMSAVMITGDERRPGGARPVTDDNWLTIEADNVVTTAGFGFLTNAVVDQHFMRRRRYARLLSLALDHPNLLGVGIDEGTALEVSPDGSWTVRGMSTVMILDPRGAEVDRTAGTIRGASLHILRNGQGMKP
ncbi:MAG: cyanophycinase [Gemmatimonadota bacterium]|nr:cyanophycinase [Gemmatimonadota bacterium]